MQPQDDNRFQWKRHNAGMIPAIILIGIGALFLLNNLNILHVDNWGQFWPVLLIAAGVYLLDGRFTGRDTAAGEARNERP